MKVSELMAGYTPDPSYKGAVTNDNWVLAIDTSSTQDSEVENYIVVGDYVESIDSQMNPSTTDKQYIRSGLSTTKTGTQRTFAISGDRFIGDEFQDFALSNAIKYGTGQKVIINYVYFCLLDGKGEKGTASIIVNSDASGNAGDNSTISIDLRKYGKNPEDYTYSAD